MSARRGASDRRRLGAMNPLRCRCRLKRLASTRCPIWVQESGPSQVPFSLPSRAFRRYDTRIRRISSVDPGSVSRVVPRRSWAMHSRNAVDLACPKRCGDKTGRSVGSDSRFHQHCSAARCIGEDQRAPGAPRGSATTCWVCGCTEGLDDSSRGEDVHLHAGLAYSGSGCGGRTRGSRHA